MLSGWALVGKAFLKKIHKDQGESGGKRRGRWVAHTSRVLVALFQRDKLFVPDVIWCAQAFQKVRPSVPAVKN